MTDRWPLDRPVEEVRTEVRRRARQRLLGRLSGGIAVVLLLAGSLAALTRGSDTTEVETAGRIQAGTTTTTGDRNGEGLQAGTSTTSSTDTGGVTTTTATTVLAGRTPDVGVGKDTITIGHVSTRTLAGSTAVVPDLDQAALGTEAVVAYQNSAGGVWGRKVVLDARDDKGVDPLANRRETQALLGRAFALVGSWSTQDHDGAAVLDGTDMPDVTRPYSARRFDLRNNYSPAPTPGRTAMTTLFDWGREAHPTAVTAVGTIHEKNPDLQPAHVAHMAAAKEAGWKVVYDREVEASDMSQTADVVRMRQNGVRAVYLVGVQPGMARRLLTSMQQQNFVPEVVIVEGPATLTDPTQPESDGVVSTSRTLLLDGQDDAIGAEVALFRSWFARVAPGRQPNEQAAMAWASGRLLFRAMDLAGTLASRREVLRALDGFDHFDANGLVADAGPGTKRPSSCLLVTRIRDRRPTRLAPARGFRCGGREIRV